MFLSTSFAFLSLSSFTNSSTHQYKSVSALPTVTIYVRYTTILATLYMIVKILWVFMTSPISTFHISSKNAIHLSWISHRVYSWHGETFRFVCLICSWKLRLAFHSLLLRACPAMFSKKTPSHFAIRLSTKYLHFHLPSARKSSVCLCGSITHAGGVLLWLPHLSLLRAPAVATRRRRGHLMCHI